MVSPHEIRRIAVEAIMAEDTVKRVYRVGSYRQHIEIRAASLERVRRAAEALGLPLPPVTEPASQDGQ